MKPQGGQTKSGASSGNSGSGNNSGSTGNSGNTAKAKSQAQKQPQSGNGIGKGKPQPKQPAGAKYSEAEYKKALLGVKTSDGKTVKGITNHAMSRMQERDIFPQSVEKALKNATPVSGNVAGRFVYSHKGTRVVFDDATEHIWTVIYRGKGRT